MNCPVCNHSELSEDTSSCPQCHSDLEVFHLIIDASEHRQKQKKIISALSVFAAVTAIGWASVGIFSGKSTSADPIELSPEVTVQGEVRTPQDADLIAALTNENASLKSENAALLAKVNTVTVKETPAAKPAAAPAVAESAEKGTIIHTVRNGDTFWIIAKKYYKDGRKYKQIAKDNGLSVKAKLHKGQKIKIVKG